MYRKILPLLMAAFLTACSSLTANEQDMISEKSSQSNIVHASQEKPDNIFESVRCMESELNSSDAPFEVSGIYEGTSFDFNGDGIDDRVFGFALYSQFEFVIFDGKTADILLDERVMEDMYLPDLSAEVYSDSLGKFRFKISEKTAKTADSEITETIQIFPDADPMILEAVYDKETGEFIHAYDKYTLDEYNEKQAELLSGYDLYLNIEWEKLD